MAQIGQMARVKLKGLNANGINHDSPLEDQVLLVHRALKMHAQASGFKKTTHNSPHNGAVLGYSGPMVLSWILSDLFPEVTDKDQQLSRNKIISQVLRRTDMAVCLHNPEHGKGESPVWFVSDRAPERGNLVTVVAWAMRGSNGAPQATFQSPMTYAERKVTPEEAGENLPPGEVTVRKKEQIMQEVAAAADAVEGTRELGAAAAAQHQRHLEIMDELLELLTQTEVALSIHDIRNLMTRTKPENSTVRNLVSLLQEREDVKLSVRTEVDSERLIRGGGSYPRGKRVQLYFIGDEVPIRTKLPDGIEPYRPASDWALEETSRRDPERLREAIMEHVNKYYAYRFEDRNASARQRRLKGIAASLGFDEDLVKEALAGLVKEGKLRRDIAYSYWPPKPELPAPPPLPAPPSLPVPAEPKTEVEVLNEISEATQAAIEDTAQQDRDRAPVVTKSNAMEQPNVEIEATRARVAEAAARRELEELRQRIAVLEADNEKLRRTVRALTENI